MTIRVLLAEDHRMVREALRDALAKMPDIEVVGEAGDARAALELARALAPDVIVLDIGLPDLNGMEVAARLTQAGNAAKIVALSAYADKRFVIEMLRSGATAYVTKSAARTELVRAIRAAAEGQSYFCAEVAGALVADVRDRSALGEAPRLGRGERYFAWSRKACVHRQSPSSCTSRCPPSRCTVATSCASSACTRSPSSRSTRSAKASSRCEHPQGRASPARPPWGFKQSGKATFA